jgi:hypothetical protein
MRSPRSRPPRAWFGRGPGVRRREIAPHRAPASVESSSQAPAVAFHATRARRRSSPAPAARSSLRARKRASPSAGVRRSPWDEQEAPPPLLASRLSLERERRWRRRPGFDRSSRQHEAITSRRCMHTQPAPQFACDVEHVAGEGRAIPRIERCGCGHEAAIAEASPRASDRLNGTGGQAIRSRNSRTLSTSRSPMSASSTSRSLETSTALAALARATR